MNARRWSQAFRLVLFMGFGLGVAIYLLGRVGTSVLPSASTYKFEADVQSSIALAANADVREAGVLIGRVDGIERAGSITAVKMSIDHQYGPIYKDATVLIRAKSIAGENYVQLNPGLPKAGQLGNEGVLAVKQELQPVQDDDVFSILEAPERAGLAHALKGLGNGLSGQGGSDLNQTLESQQALVDDGRGFAQILDEDRSETAQLVSAFDGVSGALGARGEDIQEMTKAAQTTAIAVSARDAALRATLHSLPTFLAQAKTTSDRLGTFSATATPVFANLKTAFQALVPTMEELKPAANEANTTLATLEQFATVALPTFNRLSPFAQTTSKLLAPYSKFLQQLAPLSKYLNPYAQDVGSVFANTGAAVNAQDSISKLARIILPVSRSNFPTVLNGTSEEVLAKLSGGLDTRGTNAYPLPANATQPQPLTQTVPALNAATPYTKKPPKPLSQR